MSRDDVDFVVGDERARPAGEPPPRAPHRRRWLLVGVAVVVLVAAGVTVRGLTHRGPDPSSASSASPSLSGSATQLDRDSSTALDPSRAASSPLPTPSARLGCPEFVACSKSAAIPAVVVRAVRVVFPQARPVSGQTVVLRRDNAATPEVHARLLTFHVGRLELFIRVSTPGSDDNDGPVPVNTRTVIRTVPTGQYLTVEVAAQNGVMLPGYDVLQKLVADSRLLAV